MRHILNKFRLISAELSNNISCYRRRRSFYFPLCSLVYIDLFKARCTAQSRILYSEKRLLWRRNCGAQTGSAHQVRQQRSSAASDNERVYVKLSVNICTGTVMASTSSSQSGPAAKCNQKVWCDLLLGKLLPCEYFPKEEYWSLETRNSHLLSPRHTQIAFCVTQPNLQRGIREGRWKGI